MLIAHHPSPSDFEKMSSAATSATFQQSSENSLSPIANSAFQNISANTLTNMTDTSKPSTASLLLSAATRHADGAASDDVEPASLHALHPDILTQQATLNIGVIGHVAHGKSTIVKALSGVNTSRYKAELERNITIKLGYANAKIFKCSSPACPPPACYQCFPSSAPLQPPCRVCTAPLVLQRHVSFVDCPGHDALMATMLNGVAVMDAAVAVIAGNEPCPQPQTAEHLAAAELLQLQHLIVCQNKIELVPPAEAARHYESIRATLRSISPSGSFSDAAVLPVSGQLGHNMDALCHTICATIPPPIRDFQSPALMTIVRSFDVNKPGDSKQRIGVAGGTIVRGILKIGQRVEIRPGLLKPHPLDDSTTVCVPIRATIVSLFAEQNALKFAVPGGLIGVGLDVDGSVTKGDRLVGHVLGHEGQMPKVFKKIQVDYTLLKRLCGGVTKKEKASAASSSSSSSSSSSVLSSSDPEIEPIPLLVKGEVLMLNIGSTSTGGRVRSIKIENSSVSALSPFELTAKLTLSAPVCANVGDQVAISRRVDRQWRLIGWGKIRKGKKMKILTDGQDEMKQSVKDDAVVDCGEPDPQLVKDTDAKEDQDSSAGCRKEQATKMDEKHITMSSGTAN